MGISPINAITLDKNPSNPPNNTFTVLVFRDIQDVLSIISNSCFVSMDVSCRRGRPERANCRNAFSLSNLHKD